MKLVSEGGLAVVTGGAGGLGSTFANRLAERGYRLLLVDRRRKQLEQVCESIAARYGTSVDTWTADLTQREDVQKLAKALAQIPDVELLVNNAGFGTIEYFVDTAPNYVADMADVHIVAPMILTRAVLPGMMERNRGGIINLSSMAAWFQSAGNAEYGATKCCLAVFSQSLHQELRGTGVRVQALCPGFIRTEFHNAESMNGFHLRCAPAGHLWMTAEEVVDCSLRRFGKQVIVIPGFWYRILGRLAQMPVLQPLMRRLAAVPRGAPIPAPTVESAPAPAYSVAELPESVTAL
jgi:uncharacterized protein